MSDVGVKVKKIIVEHLGVDEAKVTDEASFIDTKMTKSINEEFKKKLIENIPMGKLGNGNDIANCAVFLASDLSSYITGETIHVNGGMYMAWFI